MPPLGGLGVTHTHGLYAHDYVHLKGLNISQLNGCLLVVAMRSRTLWARGDMLLIVAQLGSCAARGLKAPHGASRELATGASRELANVTFPAPPIYCTPTEGNQKWYATSDLVLNDHYQSQFRRFRNVCVCRSPLDFRLRWYFEDPYAVVAPVAPLQRPTSELGTDFYWKLNSPKRWMNRSTANVNCPQMHQPESKRARFSSGTTLVGYGWPWGGVGHQAENAFPMLQLLHTMSRQSAEPVRMVQLDGLANNWKATPFVTGVLDALGQGSIADYSLPSNASDCYADAVFFNGLSSAWHSIRWSRLLPPRSGQHFMPDHALTTNISHAVWQACGMDPKPTRDGRAGQALQSARILVRVSSSKQKRGRGGPSPLRNFESIDALVGVLKEYVPKVTVVPMLMNETSLCAQARWFFDDLVLTTHGAHTINRVFMPKASHLIEVNPYLYEQDCNFFGCSHAHRHVLGGTRNAVIDQTSALNSTDASGCKTKGQCRIIARNVPITVDTAELRLLVKRIVQRRTFEGHYVCDRFRCSYV